MTISESVNDCDVILGKSMPMDTTLTEEDEDMLLQTVESTGDQTLASNDIFNMETLLSSINHCPEGAAKDKCVKNVSPAQPPLQPTSVYAGGTVDFGQAVLLDMQMVYHRGYGVLIKEIAFRVWNDSIVQCLNMKHDWSTVPAHLISKCEGKYYDVYTGMNVEDGELSYDDRIVANILSGVQIVFLKGANKKTALSNVYKRLGTNCTLTGSPTTFVTDVNVAAYQEPIIVNVDASTANDQDRALCKENNISMADFSFQFVYSHLNVYIQMLYDIPYTTTDTIYFTNVVSKDPRYNLAGRGRVVCLCHTDHSSGGRIKSFGKRQRCSLMNLSILDTLWFKGRDTLFRRMVKEESEQHQRQKRRRQSQLSQDVPCSTSYYHEKPYSYERPQHSYKLPTGPLPDFEHQQRPRLSSARYSEAELNDKHWPRLNEKRWVARRHHGQSYTDNQRSFNPNHHGHTSDLQMYKQNPHIDIGVGRIDNQGAIRRFQDNYNEYYDTLQHEFPRAIRHNRKHSRYNREKIYAGRVYKKNRDKAIRGFM